MSVLVTGAAGIVGYNTVIQCVEAGIDVVAYDRLECTLNPVETGSVKVDWVRGDLNDWAHLLETAKKYNVEGVIHSAALPNVSSCRPVPLSATRTNVLATQNLLELARHLNWRRVVYVSTGAVFQSSNPDGFIKETDSISPDNVYGTTKYMGELVTNMYHKTYGVDSCTVRASWVWGPPELPGKFDLSRGPVRHYLMSALRGVEVNDPTGGDFRANLTYVKDLANALVLAYQKQSLTCRTFNISNGKHYSVAEVVAAVKKVVPGAAINVGPGLAPWSDIHVLRGSFDITPAQQELGFEVKYHLEEGLADYVKWLVDHQVDFSSIELK